MCKGPEAGACLAVLRNRTQEAGVACGQAVVTPGMPALQLLGPPALAVAGG